VTGIGAAQVGEVAAANNIVLHQLADTSGSLEEAYLQVTQPTVEYRGQR
jgi:ABC-2 type transport system ATP-binding protein